MYNNLFNPTHLKRLCDKYKLNPSKKYGQNFLISENPIKAMIEAGELKKTDAVIEIGPGFGVLTLAVAPLVEKVIAFEIERKLEGYWDEIGNNEINGNREINGNNNIEMVWGNAVKNLTPHTLSLKPGYKVMANLPYQITSHVLRVILESENKPERIIVMVQKEVAERICAKPGEMSLLAVSVQYYGEPKIVARVTRGNFWPEPSVDSAIIAISKLSRVSRLSSVSDADFFKVVKAGFANKRKQLWRNLSVGLDLAGERAKDVLKSAGLGEKARAQELSVKDWTVVVEKLYNF
jgi:16S rRNA (adenine1518-N6/adenine1519-N6)-dimethyltransferase